jgi:hypothetical protein
MTSHDIEVVGVQANRKATHAEYDGKQGRAPYPDADGDDRSGSY